jgi:hypothetical protein
LVVSLSAWNEIFKIIRPIAQVADNQTLLGKNSRNCPLNSVHGRGGSRTCPTDSSIFHLVHFHRRRPRNGSPTERVVLGPLWGSAAGPSEPPEEPRCAVTDPLGSLWLKNPRVCSDISKADTTFFFWIERIFQNPLTNSSQEI